MTTTFQLTRPPTIRKPAGDFTFVEAVALVRGAR
jgi:hypothetical protein